MPNEPLILAIDQGTTNTKAILVDRRRLGRGPGLAPDGHRVPAAGLGAAGRGRHLDGGAGVHRRGAPGRPAPRPWPAIGISNQRESGVAWERDGGAPVGPAVTWQCRRSAELCDWLRGAGRAD